MECLTASDDRVIQFTEQWKVSYIAIVVMTAVASAVGPSDTRFSLLLDVQFTKRVIMH